MAARGAPKAAHSKTLVFNSPIFGSDCRSGSPVAGETSKRTGDVPTGYATQHTGLGVKLQRSGTATVTDISRNRPTDPSSGVRAADEGCKSDSHP